MHTFFKKMLKAMGEGIAQETGEIFAEETLKYAQAYVYW